MEKPGAARTRNLVKQGKAEWMFYEMLAWYMNHIFSKT